MKPARLLTVLGIAALSFVLPFTAGATVKKEGAWPTAEKKVDLEFDGKPSDGLKKLAKEADWSLVLANGVTIDNGAGDVHVEVDDQPADAVLEALFVGQNVVAHRNGTLITVTPAASGSVADAPPVAPTPASSPSPVPTVRGEDRTMIGGSLVIGKDEVVHTVTVAGGSLKVAGTVTGDLVVAGGSAKIVEGGHVVGNATAFGGSLKVEKNARIDGDVGVAGGVLKREEGAIIGGRVVDDDHKGTISVRKHNSESVKSEVEPSNEPPVSRVTQALHDFGQSMTKMALLFVLGCVLLALVTPRMDRLRVEIASRPMRSFALGLLWTLVGSISLTILIVVLCITVIGIPIAIIGVLALCVAVYGAIASLLTTCGAALIGHRTQNPYLHLLLGCGVFLVLSSIPAVGGVVTFAVAMIAIGALFSTRAGGLLERRRPTPPSGLV
jgi:cytoskeletal protein CcmA (bactofilin family)